MIVFSAITHTEALRSVPTNGTRVRPCQRSVGGNETLQHTRKSVPGQLVTTREG